MSFEINQKGDWHVVSINEPRLDAAIAESFKSFLFEQMDAGVIQVVIDLEEVRFMDSSGLGALVAGLKKLSGKGKLMLASAQPAVKDLFDLTSMEKLFSIVDSVDEAVQEG